MSRPRVARTQSSTTLPEATTAHVRSHPGDHAHRWRVRAGAITLIGLAIAIPVAASAAAQPPQAKSTPKAKSSEQAINVSAMRASQRKFRKPEATVHAKAKPAVPVAAPAPKPSPKPVVTAPPTTRYIPPVRRYVAPTTRYVAPQRRYVAPNATQGSGRCGGNLPPCYVMMRESRGSLTAHNPSSTASGKWQFLNSTWNGYGGYSSAAAAPESVQDARAAQVWAGGSGCSNWSACG